MESDSSPITLDEWIAYLSSDGEMRRDGYAEATPPAGDTIRVESPGLAVWTRHEGAGEGDLAWFDWRDGAIVVKNPDDPMLRKMCDIARTLRAHVQGDDGESYGKDAG